MKTNKRTLHGARFVLTGAAGGLGRALCAELGRKGARIIGFDADPEALKAASAALQQEGIDHHLQLLDITDAKAVRQALQGLDVQPIDGLILNAGITRILPFREMPFDQFVKVFEVNVFGAVIFAKELIEPLRSTKGVIVGISSVSGFAPLMNRTAYSASKHALAGFLETLRSEEPDLNVLVVYPSFLQTGIRSRAVNDTAAHHKAGELSANAAAARIVDAIIDRRRRLYMPLQARLARLVWNSFPDLYIKLMKKRA